ncbi:MAG: 50S ribosomal protein L1 [candidate division KSB1 bacterium]|nr:50S ribosomal protein L1 [candidate division KSB1 bacterium]MDZ7318473.1 50S ribosomal protein L1 [candidate division KSB1 bacterium]MDZ7339998.1 50S ribosomal protein L1 [candidate division KSB1 bacterium]
MKRSKRYNQLSSKVERGKEYRLDEAIPLLKEFATTKFDQSVEVAVRLGVDPRHADQMVRGTVTLPNGTGKSVRVLVLTKGAKEKEAQEAGADYVGLDEYVEKLQQGWLDCDVIIATPDVMNVVGKLGKILGPKGMMPNPKSGTVSFDVGQAVKDVKAGKIDFRVDRNGNLHAAVGKLSFDAAKIKENVRAFLEMVLRLKPSSAKGQYLRSVTLSSTMGPGIKLDRAALVDEIK